MLELRPNCECCNADLPPDSGNARICSFECTFCAPCAEQKLGGRCPNCGGELLSRPRRAAAMLAKHPASTECIVKPEGCVVRLYQGTLSSSSWRIRIALALKGIAYETVRIDIGQDEQLKPEFTGVLPLHQVPCLDIDGRRISQSVAILEYLEETRPAPALLPSDPGKRAQVRAVVEAINSVIQPLHNTPVRKRLIEQFGLTEQDGKAWSRYWIERRFDDLERILQGSSGQYCFGDGVTLADVFLYPQVESTWRFEVDMTRYPTLAAIACKLKTLAAFRDSHPREP